MKARLGAFLLLSTILLSATALQQVSAQSGMMIEVTTTDGFDLIIKGKSAKADAVTVKVENPQTGNIVFVDQGSPDNDGKFSFRNSVGILGWPEDGIYRVTVKQRDSSAYNLSVNIMVENGMMVTDKMTKSSLSDYTAMRDMSDSATTPGLSIDVIADPGSDVIRIDGTTSSTTNAVTVLVTAPNGNKIHTDQIVPLPSGDFGADINLGCQQWGQNGVYTITVQQGTNTLFKESVDVEVSSCLVVPEFGTVAMAILVASIVAIVALSARSRLSIVPRY